MAEFRTAHSQKILPLEVAVVGTVNEGVEVTASNRKAAICYGDFVKFTPANGTKPAYIEKATSAQVAAKEATHIVALTDQVFGHIPVEYADYRRSPLVGATVAASSSVAASTPVKKVGLYPIFEWGDIIADADKNDQNDVKS